MRRREAKRSTLTVRVSHEADRLGGRLLADAFERLAPTIVRRLAPVGAADRATPEAPVADNAVSTPEAPVADNAVRRGRP